MTLDDHWHTSKVNGLSVAIARAMAGQHVVWATLGTPAAYGDSQSVREILEITGAGWTGNANPNVAGMDRGITFIGKGLLRCTSYATVTHGAFADTIIWTVRKPDSNHRLLEWEHFLNGAYGKLKPGGEFIFAT